MQIISIPAAYLNCIYHLYLHAALDIKLTCMKPDWYADDGGVHCRYSQPIFALRTYHDQAE